MQGKTFKHVKDKILKNRSYHWPGVLWLAVKRQREERHGWSFCRSSCKGQLENTWALNVWSECWRYSVVIADQTGSDWSSRRSKEGWMLPALVFGPCIFGFIRTSSHSAFESFHKMLSRQTPFSVMCFSSQNIKMIINNKNVSGGDRSNIHISRVKCIMVRRFRTKEKGNFYFFKDFVVFGVLGCYFCINFFK